MGLIITSGVQVVLVGAPEYYGTDPDHLHDFEMPFREVEWCWGSLAYVNVLLYHLNEPEDLEGGTFAIGNGTYEEARIDYTPVVRLEKLLPLLEHALENVEAFESNQWQ